MINELDIELVERVLQSLKEIQKQHPKAKVVYDTEREDIIISYPLARDYWEMRKIKFNPTQPN